MNASPLLPSVERFLRYLGVERQLSPITLLNYRRQLETLIALAENAGLKSWQQCDAVARQSFCAATRPWGGRLLLARHGLGRPPPRRPSR